MSMNCISINSFSGLDSIKSNVFAEDKTFGIIANGENFTLENGIPEIARSPYKLNILIPEEDKPADNTQDIIVNGFCQVFIAGEYYYIYVINGFVYKYAEEKLIKIFDKRLSQTALCDFTVYAKKLIITNGEDKNLEYDGSSCVEQNINDPQEIIDVECFDGAEVANNRIYYYSSKSNIIYTPQPQTTCNFDNTNSTVDAIKINVSKGGYITGLRQLAGKTLIIFISNGATLRLTGSQPYSDTATDPHRLNQITGTIGGVSPFSSTDTGTEIYFVSNRGLEQLSTVETYGEIRYANKFDKIKDLISPYLQDLEGLKNCFVCYQKNKIHVLFRNMIGEAVLYSFDVMTNDIECSHYKMTITYMNIIDDTLYFGTDKGEIFRLKDTYYNHEKSFIELNYYPTKYGIETIKKWVKLILYVETNTQQEQILLTVNHLKQDIKQAFNSDRYKHIQTASLWGSAIWGKAKWGALGSGMVRFKNIGKSKAIKIRISTTEPTQHFRIKRLELFYIPLGSCKG